MTSLFVGLDAGGTKTCALVAADGDASTRFYGPGAHALRDSPRGAAETCAALVRQALDAHPGSRLAGVAVGVAGAGREDVRAATETALREALRERAADAPVALVHDAEIALEAAFGAESGVIGVVGTGSILYGRTEAGEGLRAGGWGAILGDDGSGTAIGRGALRAVLAARDGGPPTTLEAFLLARAEASILPPADGRAPYAPTAEGLIEAAQDGRVRLAALAPAVLAAARDGDWAAHRVLAREANAFAEQAGWLALQGGDLLAKRLALLGGLAAEPVYLPLLLDAFGRHLPGWAVGLSPREPVEGALDLARRLGEPSAPLF